MEKETQQIVTEEYILLEEHIISIIAHDIKSPLEHFASYIATSKEKIIRGEDTIDFIPALESFLLTCNSLLGNLLSWSRIRLSNNSVIEPFFATLVSNKLVYSLKYLYSSRNIQILNQIPKNIICEFDKGIFEFVMRNFLTNAIKYGYENSKILIRYSTHNSDFHEFIINNRGPFLPDTKLHRILSFKNSKKSQGNGIGLMLCNYCLKFHGGFIKAESSIEGGNTFSFYLPKLSIAK